MRAAGEQAHTLGARDLLVVARARPRAAAPRLRAVLCLGAIGWDAALAAARGRGWDVPRPKPRFGHAAEVRLTTPEGHGIRMVGCYHVSPHNTFTGWLTPAMLDEVLLSPRSG